MQEMRATSSHWSPVSLWSQITRRTRSLKISAPPPVCDSRKYAEASRKANQNLTRSNLSPLRKVADLHHREGFQVYRGEAFLEAAQHLAEPIEREFRMQPADDVKLR